MFALFYSLYFSMFIGSWNYYNMNIINNNVQPLINKVVMVLTNIFNNTSTNIADLNMNATEVITLCSLILALITSIGIVVMAVKGVKKAFGIFFMGINRL